MAEEIKGKILKEAIDYSNKLMKKKVPELSDNYYSIKHDGVFVKGITKAISLAFQERNTEVKQVIEELEKKAKRYINLGKEKSEDYFFGHGFDSCLKELLQMLGLGDGE